MMLLNEVKYSEVSLTNDSDKVGHEFLSVRTGSQLIVLGKQSLDSLQATKKTRIK